MCYSGSARQVQELKSGTEEATGTTITLDDNNCVAGYESTGAEGYDLGEHLKPAIDGHVKTGHHESERLRR